MRCLIHCLIGAFVFAALQAARGHEPVSLERTLVRAAPEIIQYCRAHGYKSVGVLKFLAHKAGQGGFSDNVGTLNRLVARRLELAMILANDPADPIGIIEDASDIAARTVGANHLSKEGRAKLFERRYPLAWGKEPVLADAFITGLVHIDADLRQLSIRLLVFDRSTISLATLGEELVAANDARKLSEIGESFHRGAFDDGTFETGEGDSTTNTSPKTSSTENATPDDPQEPAKQDEQVLAKAVAVSKQLVKNPAEDSSASVKLEVLYDGRPVPFEFKDGKAFIPEPNEHQQVTFRLKRRDSAGGTFGCVLKVNGENTLFRQRQPDAKCHRWLLRPNNTTGLEIVGFQQSDKTSQAFRVLSREESQEHEIDYGADVGTITLSVYGELKGTPPPEDLSDETESTKVVEKATLPDTKAENFNALTAQLLADANRGLITEGTAVDRTINMVTFQAEPTPLMSLTVIYYQGK